MRYVYESSLTPPRPHEAVKGVATLLSARVALLAYLGGPYVYDFDVPADLPESGKRIVVRERIDMGSSPETVSGLMTPTIQVMTESKKGTFANAAARHDWHGDVHDEVLKTLVRNESTGDPVTISVTNGEAKMPRRAGRASPVAHDADKDVYYSTYEFRVTMGPA